MADYNKPIRKNKRKKDPPWAEAFDRGEITPEQERKILAADKKFKGQMAQSDKHAQRAKGYGALAKGVGTVGAVSSLHPLKGGLKQAFKHGGKLLGKLGKSKAGKTDLKKHVKKLDKKDAQKYVRKSGTMTETISDATKLRRRERPDAPFRKSTDKEAEWYRGELDKLPAGKYHGNQQRVKGKNVRQYYMRTPSGGLQPWRPPGFKEGLGAGVLGGGAAGIALEKMKNNVKKESEANKQLKKSITKKATKKKPKPYWPEDFGDLDAEEARVMGRRAKRTKPATKNYDDID